MNRKRIVLVLLLSLPVIALVLHHYWMHAPGLTPTGFLMSENVLYMSYAHQYLDQDSFSFFIPIHLTGTLLPPTFISNQSTSFWLAW